MDAPTRGEEQIGLEGQAVAVAAGHLQDRLAAMLLDQKAAAQGRVAHDRALMVGDVQAVDHVLEQVDVVDQGLQVGPLGWGDLAGHDEDPRVERFL